MSLFKKKCTLCKAKIEKGKEIMADIKLPEWLGFKEKPFCSKKHAKLYETNIIATPRTSYCPSCGI